MSPKDITGIHHLGLIVTDMGRAIATFERLGFNVKAPAYAALPPSPGGTPQPIGATNTHADFPRNFIELVGLAPDSRDQLPEDATVIPLSIPEDRLEDTLTAMQATVANIATRLALGEGAHILVFTSRDAEQTAERLDGAGVGHGGARAVQRPIITAAGTRLAGIKYLEVNENGPAVTTGLVPEGRVGVAEDVPGELLDAQLGLAHPNGAVGLVECVLSVGLDEFDSTVDRYERYLGVEPTVTDSSTSFELASGRVSVTAASGSGARLTAYTVAVTDLEETERYIRAQGIEVGQCGDGRRYVPADAALGTLLMFEQAV